jgi:Pyruvate/2-oxoacid:ferredoxin oxidoreductase delta subunit
MTPDEPRATGGYWQQNISGFVDPKCKQREAIQCQEIDADCNDCLYFVTEKDSKRVRYGSCKRWNINVIACPQQSSAMPCFVHRLTRVEATWNGTISPTDTRVIQKQAQAEKRFLDGTH